MNRVVLVGRIARDPELRTLPSGDTKAIFALAVGRPPQSNGQRGVDFIECVAWRQHAGALARFAHKGELLAVEGRLTVRDYQEDGGQKRIVEVTVTDFSFARMGQEQDEEEDRPRRQAGGPRTTTRSTPRSRTGNTRRRETSRR